MKKIIIFIFILTSIQSYLSGQNNNMEWLEGDISFVTKKNVYVKFEATKDIQIGDTVYIKINDKYKPGLLISKKSSVSILCIPLSTNKFVKGQKVFVNSFLNEIKKDEKEVVIEKRIPDLTNSKDTISKIDNKPKAVVKGRFTVATNSNIASFNEKTGNHRFRYIFAMKGDNIINSKFYFDHYISFYKTYDIDFKPSDKIRDKVRFYRVSFGYKSKSLDISIGRQIKNKISALGSFDGLYVEKKIKNDFYTGIISGTRPDYSDYGFNSNLFQYGAFISYFPNYKKSSTRGSIAFFEQKNNGEIDRRFMYAQFSTNLGRKIRFFGASEIDLYQLKEGQTDNSPKITNIYGNLAFKLSRKFNFSVGFDSRKNRIYYETYKDFLETFIERETRQGLRFRAGYRPFKKISISLMSNFRFQDKVLSSKYYNAMLFLRNIPGIKSSISISAGMINTSYLDSKSISVRLSKRIQRRINLRLEYKYYNYFYLGTETTRTQNRVGGSINFNLAKRVYFSIYYENALQKDRNYSRLNLRATKRF